MIAVRRRAHAITVREADRGTDGKFKRDAHTAQAREHILAASIALNQGDKEEAKRRLESAQIHASHSQHKNAQKVAAELGKIVENYDIADDHKIASKLDECYGNLQGEANVLLKVKKHDSNVREAQSIRETLTFFPRFVEGSYNEAARTADVIIITEGLGNRRDKHLYTADTIKEAVSTRVFEGAQAYADHPSKFEDQNRPERSIRDLIGYYFDSRLTQVPDKNSGKMLTAYAAKLKIQEGCDWALGLIREAIEYNKKFPNNTYVGISINADGDTVPFESPSFGHVNKVVKITEAFSADVVTKPARQGGFLKLVEGAAGAQITKSKEQGMATKAQVLEAAAKLEKLAEGDSVDPSELKQLAATIREGKFIEEGTADKADEKLGAAKAEVKEAKDGKKDAEDAKDGGDDELEEGKGKSKESADEKGGNLRESITSVDDLKKQYPSLYAAALKEAETNVGSDVTALRKENTQLKAERALTESTRLAVRLLQESKVPQGGHKRMLQQLIGLNETEMREAIAAEEEYVESLGIVTSKTAGNGQRVQVRESDRASNTNAITAGLYD